MLVVLVRKSFSNILHCKTISTTGLSETSFSWIFDLVDYFVQIFDHHTFYILVYKFYSYVWWCGMKIVFDVN